MTDPIARAGGTARLLLVAVGLVAGWHGVAIAGHAGDGAETDDPGWVVSPSRAAELVGEGEATLLDARGRETWAESHVEGAVPVDWEAFTPDEQSSRGTLLGDDEQLERRLEALGIVDDRPVLVVGKSGAGWGEAGRIVWMLRTLGHGAVGWVDGGHAALVEAGASTKEGADDADTSGEGRFDVKRREDWSIDRSTLRAIYRDEDVVLVDTREPREYRGETPYGESRGGHIPGAKHLYFKELLGEDGRLESPSTIREMLAERGIEPGDRVVTYCTGGVRSAWVASVLVDLGFDDVQNYAGSTWQWAAGAADRFPLEDD